MSSLTNLIPDSAIALDVDATTWQSAIRASGALLEKAGTVTAHYTDLMIQSVEEHGPYIVLTPGFALAHARPDPSVQQTSLSFARLATPVNFGSAKNDPVTIVMSLAATDATAHQKALAALAGVLSDAASRVALDTATSDQEIREILSSKKLPSEAASAHTSHQGSTLASTEQQAPPTKEELASAPASKGHILCVCGNGVGSSLFLKSTLEKVLVAWGWDPFIDVEATDTISAKGKAGSSDFVLTSRAIAETLGDLGVAVEVINDFTSTQELDGVLRRRYAV